MARIGRPQLREAGRVALIGCGPGDPDLLTLKAVQRLQEADVLVVDRLVNPKVLEYARRDAERIFVGKTPGGPTTSQAEINRILVREAQAGKVVARLKGGDPFIFGRAAEEMAALPSRRHRRRGGAWHHGRARLRRAHRPARDTARARAPVLDRHRRHRRWASLTSIGRHLQPRARRSRSTWASATRRCCAATCWLPAPMPATPVVIVENGTLRERARHRHHARRPHRRRRAARRRLAPP